MAAVEVFLGCDVQCTSTGLGLWWSGIGPEQIRAACALKRVPHRQWPEIVDDVRYMGSAVAETRNRKAAQRSR